MKNRHIWLLRFILSSFCVAFMVSAGQIHREPSEKPITITVWVHGSIIIPNFILRNFFYRKLGMVNAKNYLKQYHYRAIAEILCRTDPVTYQMNNFYFFGWSGALNYQRRKQAARQLYVEICNLLEIYTQKHPNTPIYLRLMSHSHGGNVVLNLCQVQDKDKPLICDELILLACPVQYATKDYIGSNCFKKIYSFYSGMDLYQILDFQLVRKKKRTLKLYSDRRFEELPHVRQAKVKVNGWSLSHIEFLLQSFLRHIPALCAQVDQLYDTCNEQERQREKLLHVTVHRRNRATIKTKIF